MSVRAFLVLLVPVALLLAGCAAPAAETPAADLAPAATPAAKPRVVVADVDTGINPYHVEFRDDSPEAWLHPSTYLPGYPADTPALNLTFDAEDYESAVLADCETWLSVEPGRMYWIPGTRIVGAITFDEGEGMKCKKDDLPHLILDQGGHGTMTASRVAGKTYSLCPECKIVAIQGFLSSSMAWAAAQPFIDLQTNSWGALPTDHVEARVGMGRFDRREVLDAAATHPVFVAGGNGLLGFFGVAGHPAYLDDIAGPDGVVMVGGHDGGRFTPWTMTMPHVVADANWHPAAHHDSFDGGDDRTGGGTSGATPFAAGTFARLLLEARAFVGDLGVGARDGNLVLAGPDATLPAEGPLADGMLTLEEAKVLFFHTANPRPVRDGERDGKTCSPTESPVLCTLYPTTPVEWGLIPTAVPAYYFVGYGQVGELTLNATLAAMRGEQPIPERPVEDAFYGFDSRARRAFD